MKEHQREFKTSLPSPEIKQGKRKEGRVAVSSHREKKRCCKKKRRSLSKGGKREILNGGKREGIDKDQRGNFFSQIKKGKNGYP